MVFESQRFWCGVAVGIVLVLLAAWLATWMGWIAIGMPIDR
jgi:hypothetical protein